MVHIFRKEIYKSALGFSSAVECLPSTGQACVPSSALQKSKPKHKEARLVDHAASSRTWITPCLSPLWAPSRPDTRYPLDPWFPERSRLSHSFSLGETKLPVPSPLIMGFFPSSVSCLSGFSLRSSVVLSLRTMGQVGFAAAGSVTLRRSHELRML